MCSRVLNYSHGTRLVFSLLTTGLTTVSTSNGYGLYDLRSILDRGREIYLTNVSVPALRMQCVLKDIYRELMWSKSGAVISQSTRLHGLVLKKRDNQITAGFSDLLEAAQSNTHTHLCSPH
jgi:hypothetical protein